MNFKHDSDVIEAFQRIKNYVCLIEMCFKNSLEENPLKDRSYLDEESLQEIVLKILKKCIMTQSRYILKICEERGYMDKKMKEHKVVKEHEMKCSMKDMPKKKAPKKKSRGK